MGEVLRGNERPQGATDLAKPNPEAADQAAERIACVMRAVWFLHINSSLPI